MMSMLHQLMGKQVMGDGERRLWRDIKAIIPSRHYTKIKQHGNCQQKSFMRDEALREVRRYGHQGWK